ncbi:MAG: glycerol-3-phosphate dehydrogenase [Phyllobacteriaceae bacterium]|nr:glycerol-3-phosphate dehydrogenase [Phyllobacteriaceae bacterium]
MNEIYDLAVIGGGVNGCAVARDAVGRGLSVHLSEMNDLASSTSSASTKLIHGGLRYLEYYEFRLVRESLAEREIVWRLAPHLVEPLRFVLPHHRGLRPAWMLRLGLFLYDHLGARRLLPPTRVVDLSSDPVGASLAPGQFRRGFEYSDCRVDDSRFVVATARDAAARGATIATRTRVVAADRGAEAWTLHLAAADGSELKPIRARVVVDTAGPWVHGVARSILGLEVGRDAGVRLVQGSHVVVRRLWDHDRAFIFQNADGRVVFAIPWLHDFTLIGTTDRDFTGDPARVSASEEEIAYLLEAVNPDLARPITHADVVWSFSGVRPLWDDGASDAKSATRDYVERLDAAPGRAVGLAVYGGKLTTARRLAEAVLATLGPHLAPHRGLSAGWTASAPLPGGDFPVGGRVALVESLRATRPWLDSSLARRLVETYGSETAEMLGDARALADLGRDFGAGLSERELDWLVRREWAQTAEDVLWRRTKLGLRFDRDGVAAVTEALAARRG